MFAEDYKELSLTGAEQVAVQSGFVRAICRGIS
jgi:hypothetical protein